MDPKSLLASLFETHQIIAGVDEAGRGPLAGPVFAASVAVTKKDLPLLENLGVRDSKKLTAKRREELAEIILEKFRTGIGMCSVATIDRINILEATFLAMKKSLTAMRGNPDFLIIDGNHPIPALSIRQRAVIDADALIPLVSAASIIAKTARDRFIAELAPLYPQYGFERHKGYGTKAHLEALAQYGPCPLHRKSFGPVKRMLLFTKSE